MNIKRQRPVLAILILIVVGFGLVSGIRVYKDKREDRVLAGKAAQLVSIAKIDPALSAEKTADQVSLFVRNNSEHRIDAEFKKTWGQVDKQMDQLSAYAEKRRDTKPPMECSSRSGIAERMLWAQGLKTRSVAVWRMVDRFPSHTFLEVWNDQTARWEAIDPDFGFYWMIQQSGARAGIEDLLRQPIDRFTMCSLESGCPDPRAQDKALLDRMASLFSLAVVRDHAAGTKRLYVNPDRFDLSRRVETADGPRSFCEQFEKYCREERVIISP